VETARAAVGTLRATVNEEGKTRIKQRYVVSAPVAGQLRRILRYVLDEQEFLSPYGSDFFYAIHGAMLDAPYVGRKTYDLVEVLEWLRAAGHTDWAGWL